MATSEAIELDISGLDVSAILHYIQSAYKYGFDDITVKFKNTTTTNLKTNTDTPTIDAIRLTVQRLIGAEIIREKQNLCIIRDISQTAPQEFDNVLRRIFILIRDMAKDIADGVKSGDKTLLKQMDERHDTITKFIGFCLRLLNKKGHKDFKKTSILFHIIASLDKVTDILKYCARKMAALDDKPTKKLIQLIEQTSDSLLFYYDLYYKYKDSLLLDLSRNRRFVRSELMESLEKLPRQEIVIATQYIDMLEILTDLMEWRMALNHSAVQAPHKSNQTPV